MKMTYTNDDQCIFSDQCQKQFYRRVNRFKFEGGGEVVHNYGKVEKYGKMGLFKIYQGVDLATVDFKK